jgi:hypothetical protein
MDMGHQDQPLGPTRRLEHRSARRRIDNAMALTALRWEDLTMPNRPTRADQLAAIPVVR